MLPPSPSSSSSASLSPLPLPLLSFPLFSLSLSLDLSRLPPFSGDNSFLSREPSNPSSTTVSASEELASSGTRGGIGIGKGGGGGGGGLLATTGSGGGGSGGGGRYGSECCSSVWVVGCVEGVGVEGLRGGGTFVWLMAVVVVDGSDRRPWEDDMLCYDGPRRWESFIAEAAVLGASAFRLRLEGRWTITKYWILPLSLYPFLWPSLCYAVKTRN
jgi:hypothetical protein